MISELQWCYSLVPHFFLLRLWHEDVHLFIISFFPFSGSCFHLFLFHSHCLYAIFKMCFRRVLKSICDLCLRWWYFENFVRYESRSALEGARAIAHVHTAKSCTALRNIIFTAMKKNVTLPKKKLYRSWTVEHAWSRGQRLNALYGERARTISTILFSTNILFFDFLLLLKLNVSMVFFCSLSFYYTFSNRFVVKSFTYLVMQRTKIG